MAAVALGAPLVLGLFPKIRLPAIVLEILLGIVIGPQVLGWVSIALVIGFGLHAGRLASRFGRAIASWKCFACA